MKKIFSLIITLMYLSVNSCFAFSELYYLKNTKADDLKPVASNALTGRSFAILKQDPFYAKSRINPKEYAVIIIQQSGDNVFYYYQSNENKKVNSDFLKAVKRSNIEYEQSYNANIINIYDNIANRTMNSNSLNSYTFDEPEDTVYLDKNVSSKTQTVQIPSTLKGSVVQLEAGSKIKVYLQTPINTSSAMKGDSVVAVLTENVRYNGYTVLPQGSIVQGTLTKARPATYGSRNGRVVINFDKIITPDNQTYSISTEKIDFTVTNDGKLQRTVSSAATGAVVGALCGLLFGALSRDANLAASTAIGAGIGAGTALAGSAVERGVDAEIPSFTEMELTLSKSLRVALNY